MTTFLDVTSQIQAEHPIRTVLRSTGVLAISLGLTIAVLIAAASVVDTLA